MSPSRGSHCNPHVLREGVGLPSQPFTRADRARGGSSPTRPRSTSRNAACRVVSAASFANARSVLAMARHRAMESCPRRSRPRRRPTGPRRPSKGHRRTPASCVQVLHYTLCRPGRTYLLIPFSLTPAYPLMDERVPGQLRALMVELPVGPLRGVRRVLRARGAGGRRFLPGRMRDQAQADDLVQETFLQIASGPAHVRPGLSAGAVGDGHCAALLADGLAARRRGGRGPPRTSPSWTCRWGGGRVVRGRVEVGGRWPRCRRRSGGRDRASRVGAQLQGDRRAAGIAETAAKLRSSRGVAQLRSLLGRR